MFALISLTAIVVMFNRKEHDGELLENFLNKNIDFSRNLYAHSKHNVKVIYTLLNFNCLFWFSHIWSSAMNTSLFCRTLW